MKKVIKRLKSNIGESLGETLVATLIASLGMIILAGAFAASSKVDIGARNMSYTEKATGGTGSGGAVTLTDGSASVEIADEAEMVTYQNGSSSERKYYYYIAK